MVAFEATGRTCESVSVMLCSAVDLLRSDSCGTISAAVPVTLVRVSGGVGVVAGASISMISGWSLTGIVIELTSV
ncbi:hypothetical protein AB7M16_002367 [Bradyrhizobium sp. USDA 372]